MGLKNSDFSLVNEDFEDDTFHMIEIKKKIRNKKQFRQNHETFKNHFFKLNRSIFH
jgi:hypothetical protein